MKNYLATLVLAIAAGVPYFIFIALPMLSVLRGTFVGEFSHGGFQYPLMRTITLLHADGWIFASFSREILFFSIVGTMVYASAGAVVGWVFDSLVSRLSRHHENAAS